MACPFMVVDSRCPMLSITNVRIRSNGLVIPPSNSSGFMPVYCQATAITGISIFGKISVGVRRIMTGLKTKISTARTMKVYGRSRATRTIHIGKAPHLQLAKQLRELKDQMRPNGLTIQEYLCHHVSTARQDAV